MKTRTSMWTVAAAAILTAGLGGAVQPALAATDTEKCQAAKLKAGGKNALDVVKCHEKSLKSGLPLDDECFMRAGERIGKAIVKADAIGWCPGTENAIEAAVTTCVAGLLGEVFGTPTTTSTTTTTLPCAGGKSVGGSCWYMGNLGADCNATCAAQGKAYDPATGSFAGSGGTAVNCEAVLAAFGSTFDQSLSGGGGIGCGVFLTLPPAGIRDTDPTTASAVHGSVLRVCACQ